jgi:hypothetical protein
MQYLFSFQTQLLLKKHLPETGVCECNHYTNETECSNKPFGCIWDGDSNCISKLTAKCNLLTSESACKTAHSSLPSLSCKWCPSSYSCVDSSKYGENCVICGMKATKSECESSQNGGLCKYCEEERECKKASSSCQHCEGLDDFMCSICISFSFCELQFYYLFLNNSS